MSDGGGAVGQYWYDGDGKRVKKWDRDSGEVTGFVYDAAGKLIAEYTPTVASTSEAKVAYLTNDHLSSPRINTDANGAVSARNDYRPFGEEISTIQRTPGLGYVVDVMRKQFTGYERDGETELDFAQIRYSSYALGRFTSPDPIMASATKNNPQTFNRYVYVRNNPMNLIDPSGMIVECPPPRQCLNDEMGEYFVNDQGIAEYTNPIKVEAARACEPKCKSEEEKDIETENRRHVDFGLGWHGGVDQFNSGEGFEIHVYDRNNQERGVVSGRHGWIRKHGIDPPNPADIPRPVLNKVNSVNVEELRRRNNLPERFRGGAYLFSGRILFGAINIVGIVDGFVNDYALQQRASENGRTFQQQQAIELMEQGPYINTMLGPMRNPYYGTVRF